LGARRVIAHHLLEVGARKLTRHHDWLQAWRAASMLSRWMRRFRRQIAHRFGGLKFRSR